MITNSVHAALNTLFKEFPSEDFTFAIRHYDDWYPATGERFVLQDSMVRKVDGTFALFIAGEFPGDAPIEEPMTLPEVFAWYKDFPEQIERVVVYRGD
jgi:hypothetical protein